ncbi:MAG: hypothetical protein JW757_00710 [Anaerolineales bacterium]|nr:hypothetical protein [Anaerolineales bacterium]
MSSFSEYEEARRILVRAVAEIKDGEFPTARRYLERLLNIPSTSEQKAEAYYWLSQISETKEEKREHLETVLSYDLTHHRARKALAILDGRLSEDEIIDPDDFEQTVPEGVQKREADRFECPTCGARMVFSPDGQTLVCEHCDREGGSGLAGSAGEQEFLLGISTAKGHQQAVAMQSFECRSCGAVYLLGPQTLSITCAHCDSTYSIRQAEVRELIPPEGIIPMAVGEAQVENLIKQKALRQSGKFGRLRAIALKGVYLPAWTFDIDGQIKWTGYVEVQENHPVPVRDSRPVHFDDLFVPASKPEPRFFNHLLGEFEAVDVVSFKPEFLANWLAESYQIPMADAAVRARSLAFKLSQKLAYKRSRLSNVQNLRFYSDDILLTSYKLVLVPVWIGQLQYAEKEQPVLVNGQSGRVYMDQLGGWMKKALGWLLDD